jgi:hypothetical protein
VSPSLAGRSAPQGRRCLWRPPQALCVRLRSALHPQSRAAWCSPRAALPSRPFHLSHPLLCLLGTLHTAPCTGQHAWLACESASQRGAPRAVRAQLLALVTASAAYIRTLHGWRTVCALVTMTSLHPDAAATALAALAAVARPPALAPPSFPACLEAVMAVAERNSKVPLPARPYPKPIKMLV